MLYNDWQHCDGYVKDVDTALVAMAISCVCSVVLIFLIERMKLLFYQTAEQKYEMSDSLSFNDRSKYL